MTFGLIGIWLLVAVTVGAIVFLIARQQWRLWRPPQRPALDITPDCPQPFGYKITWLAVKNATTSELAAAISLKDQTPANWKSGIQAAYGDFVFVTPEMNGWVLAVGTALPQYPEGRGTPDRRWHNFMESISKTFHSACYFGSHRVVSFTIWSKWERGQEIRTQCDVGDVDFRSEHGPITPAEIEARENFLRKQRARPSLEVTEDDFESDVWLTDEEDVLHIAEQWSISPANLNTEQMTPLGIVGCV